MRFNARLHAFARYWGFTPRACAPYRARTKGKDERGIGYVKRNAIAGRRFNKWAAFEAHLDRWTREIADQRVHGSTGVAPAERFAEEAMALRPLGGRAPFGQLRDLVRKEANRDPSWLECRIKDGSRPLGPAAASGILVQPSQAATVCEFD